MEKRQFMKLLIPFLILFFSFCNGKKEQNINQNPLDKKQPEMLLLKLYWFEGEVTILRNNESIPVKMDLELEKDDLIKTGPTGTAELLLGINHHIKLGNLTEISVTNSLTADGNTTSNLSLKKGKALVVSKEEKGEENSIQTPNLVANTKDSIALFQIIPDNKKPKETECDKNSCLTKLIVLNGNLQIRIAENPSDLLLEKKFQISIKNENEISPNKILPLDRDSILNAKNMLTFHFTETVIDSLLLEEFKVEPELTKTPQQVVISKTTTSKKPSPQPKKITPQKTIANRKLPSSKKPQTKDVHRDKLKLEPNKKF